MANKEIKLGAKVINLQSEPYLIAEIGINHNGDLQIAKKLIDAANATGWDAVKFQKRCPDIAVPEAQKSVPRETPWGTMTYLEYKKRIEFEKPEYDVIDRYCADKPIAWTASPWDMPSLEFLMEYNVPFIKIASATNDNEDILKAACKYGKPLIVSTGMSTLEEIDYTVELLEKYGNGDYILLHTNSVYPAKEEELNLKVMDTLKERYDCLVGYSGHEMNLEPTVIAAAMGAKVIERHVTLSHDMWGTDQKASLEVHAMDMLRKRLMGAVRAVGDGQKVMYEDEAAVRKKLRGH